MYHQTPTSYKFIAILFLGVATLLGFTIANFSLARATIIIETKPEKIVSSYSFRITTPEKVAENPSSINDDVNKLRSVILGAETKKTTDNLEGKVIERTVSGSRKFKPKAESKKKIEDIARGQVTIINNSNRNQSLVRNTRLLSKNGVLFRTDQAVTVPQGEKVTVSARADHANSKGAKGNIDPTTFTIPGLSPSYQKVIYGESRESFSGGVKEIAEITAKDIEAAKREFVTELEKQGFSELNKDDQKITLSDITSRVLEIKTDAKEGDTASEFDVTGKIAVQAISFDKDLLENLTKKNLEASLSSDKSLVNFDKKSFSYSVKSFDEKKGEAQVESSIEADVVIKDTENLDKKSLVGLSERQARERFLSNPQVLGVTVKLSPFWVKKVPRRQNNIKIVVKTMEDQQKQLENIYLEK